MAVLKYSYTAVFPLLSLLKINISYPPLTGYFKNTCKGTSDWFSRLRTDTRLQMFAFKATATLNMDFFQAIS